MKNVVPFLSNDAYPFIRINFIVLIKILNNCEPDQNPDRLKFVNLQIFYYFEFRFSFFVIYH